jgi:hypothetical protein
LRNFPGEIEKSLVSPASGRDVFPLSSRPEFVFAGRMRIVPPRKIS